MNYRARVGSEQRDLSLTARPSAEGAPAAFEALFAGGAPFTVESSMEGDTLLLRIGDKTWRTLVDPGRPSLSEELVHLKGETIAVELSRAGARAAGAGGRLRAGPVSVTSPMPGRVVAVRVAKGDRVARGDLLLTLEAMKMQNEFTAPVAGLVAEVLVGAGAVAAAGEVLATIVPDADSP